VAQGRSVRRGGALADGYYGGGRGYEPPFSWTGFYLGANVGYAWDANHPTRIVTNNLGGSTAPFDTPKADGGFFGVHAGYNLQFGRIVLGVEADAEAPMPGLIHGDNCGVVVGGQCGVLVGANFIQAEKQQDYFGTVRGRVGVAFDRVLVYGSGGFAYGSIHDHVLVNGVANLQQDGIRTGFAAGGGIEYALNRNLSLKLEYLRVDLGVDRLSAPVIPPNGVTVFIDRIPHDFDTVRVGFDYRFGEEHRPLK